MAVPFGVNDYPGCCDVGQPPYCGCGAPDYSCRDDQWGYGAGQCVSLCAHRLNQGGLDPAGFGNADTWAERAAARGWPVDGTCHGVGDIVCFPAGCNGAGDAGHVAVALGITNGLVTVEQYNYLTSAGWCAYSHHVFAVGCGMAFIHPPWPPGALPCSATSCPPGYTCSGGDCVPVTSPPPPASSSGGLLVAGTVLAGAAGLGVWAARRHPAPGQRRLTGGGGFGAQPVRLPVLPRPAVRAGGSGFGAGAPLLHITRWPTRAQAGFGRR